MVTPGFVDGHTHMDAQVFWDPLGTCSCWHGVTSAVMGNCGFTLAPCRERSRTSWCATSSGPRTSSRERLAGGHRLEWETFPEYLDAVDARAEGHQLRARNVGHSALRTWAMGERAFEEEATDDDLAVMRRQLEASIRAGAIGFTTSRTEQPRDLRRSARRLAAGRRGTRFAALVGVMGDLGAGIFEMANEAHGDEGGGSPTRDRMRDAGAGRRDRPAHDLRGRLLAIDADWRGYLLDFSTTPPPKAGAMVGQAHSREFLSVLLSFKTRLPFDGLPTWRSIRARSLDGQRAALLDPTTSARLVDAALNGPYGTAIGAEARAAQLRLRRASWIPAEGLRRIRRSPMVAAGDHPVEP